MLYLKKVKELLYECLDIFISVHTMSMRLCVACTSYVFLSLVDVLIYIF